MTVDICSSATPATRISTCPRVPDGSAATGDERARRLRYELGLVRTADGLFDDHMARVTGSRSYRVAE